MISPQPAYVTSTLVGSGFYVDLDNDPESGSAFRWFRNGIVIPGENGKSLAPGTLAVNDSVIFEYTPKDGKAFGAAVNSTAHSISGAASEDEEDTLALAMTRFSILNEDRLRPGDSMMVLVTLENNGNTDLEHVRVSFAVPELGIWTRIGPFDLDDGDEVTRMVRLEIPRDAASGYYDLRATASEGNLRRVKHREFVVTK